MACSHLPSHAGEKDCLARAPAYAPALASSRLTCISSPWHISHFLLVSGYPLPFHTFFFSFCGHTHGTWKH